MGPTCDRFSGLILVRSMGMFPLLRRAKLARAVVRGSVGLAILGLTGCVVREYNSPPPPPPPPPQPAYVAPPPPPPPGVPDAPAGADAAPPPQDQVEVVSAGAGTRIISGSADTGSGTATTMTGCMDTGAVVRGAAPFGMAGTGNTTTTAGSSWAVIGGEVLLNDFINAGGLVGFIANPTVPALLFTLFFFPSRPRHRPRLSRGSSAGWSAVYSKTFRT